MPREIKFRAWDNDLVMMLPIVDISAPLQEFKWLGRADLPIMQFTGLKDSKGVEIFEGDICKYTTGKKSGGVYSKPDVFIGEVIFSDGEFMVGKHNGYGGVWESLSFLVGSYHQMAKDFEIIGNIYQNQDLIKN